jgi:hypothetical protein
MYERLLRRAGAPLDIAERRVLFLASDSDIDDDILSTEAQEDLKTVLSPTPVEQPANICALRCGHAHGDCGCLQQYRLMRMPAGTGIVPLGTASLSGGVFTTVTDNRPW